MNILRDIAIFVLRVMTLGYLPRTDRSTGHLERHIGPDGHLDESRHDRDSKSSACVGSFENWLAKFPVPQRPCVPEHYDEDDVFLDHHLCYIDLLVRAEALRWYLISGIHRVPEEWGMRGIGGVNEIDDFMFSGRLRLGQRNDRIWCAIEKFAAPAIELRRKVRTATPRHVQLRLLKLRDRLGLDDIDLDLILIALLPSIQPRYQRLFGILQDDASLVRPNVGLVLSMLDPILCAEEISLALARSLFQPTRPVWASRVLQLVGEQGKDGPLPNTQIDVDEDIVNFILGRDRSDWRLEGLIRKHTEPVRFRRLILDRKLRRAAFHLARRFRAAQPEERPIFFFYGPYGSGRLDVVRAISRRLTFEIDVERAMADPARWDLIVDLSYREAALGGATLVWRNVNALDRENVPPLLREKLLDAAEQSPVPTFFIGDTAWDPKRRFRARHLIRLGFPLPNVKVRTRLWERHLPRECGTTLNVEWKPGADRHRFVALLAHSFQLTKGQILDAVAASRALAAREGGTPPRLRKSQVEAGCRRQAGRNLHVLARHISPRPGMDFHDLILPEAAKRQLDELLERIRCRSRVMRVIGGKNEARLNEGLLTLFTGSSGTGKTMAAEILATLNRVDLYKVDMSRIVSKWVGETEQNLARVFDDATDSNAILFFDEADALFGKRAEVRDARDRWANQEVNFLLQRVEEFAGIVIMATNFQQNIDPAFHRRIHVIIEFPFPDVRERVQIWRILLKNHNGIPGHDLTTGQFNRLGRRFDVSGGSIRNVVVDAVFRAQASDSIVTFDHIMIALGREFQKSSRPIKHTTFGDRFDLVMKELYPPKCRRAS